MSWRRRRARRRAPATQAGEDGAIAEGRLIERNDAIILKLPQTICLKGDEDSDNIPASAEIHVYALDDGLQETLRSLIGKDVHLRGSLWERTRSTTRRRSSCR